MSWEGLDGDRAAIVGLVDSIAGSPAASWTEQRAVLAEHGIWTLGTALEHGGGGADAALSAVAIAALAGHDVSLAWGAVQTHVLVDLLGGRLELETWPVRLHGGAVGGAVAFHESVDEVARVESGQVMGRLARVDLPEDDPVLAVVGSDGLAWLVEPTAITSVTRELRTGLADAGSASVEFSGRLGESVHRLVGVDVEGLQTRLFHGAAAVAAGAAQAAVRRSTAYAGTRHQFGSQLTALPTIRESLRAQQSSVEALLVEVTQQPTRTAIAAVDVADRACEMAIDVMTFALLGHGGYGYLKEYVVEGMLRDVISLRAAIDTEGWRRRVALRLGPTA